jgi:hypothetical protein
VPKILKSHPVLRRGAVLLIVFAMVLDTAILAISAYARVARDHVTVTVAVEHEIVQVFVNCELAHPAFTDTPAGSVVLPLGWLDRGDIITIQVRGRKRPGFYLVSMQHGSQSEQIAQGAAPGQPQRFRSGRVIFASSLTAGGRRLGALGCQPDSSARLEFASTMAGTPARWGGGSRFPIDAAHALSPVVPLVLAVIGALGLIGGAVFGKVQHGASSRRTFAQVLAALIDILFLVLSVLATEDFSIALSLCVVAGVGSLLAVLVWLLVDDIRGLCLRWSLAGSAPAAGSS